MRISDWSSDVCSSDLGWTPWNTYLACEENFNNYFGTTSDKDTRNAAQKRYGLAPKGAAYRWEEFEARFDYAKEPNEAHRYGWIVAIDRKSVVYGKSVSVRFDLGGRGIIKKKHKHRKIIS